MTSRLPLPKWAWFLIQACVCCCFPCLTIVMLPPAIRESHEWDIRQGNRRLQGGKPRDIQLRRRREVSLSRRRDPKNSESKCHLLNLPFEVRSQIWRECLGDNDIVLILSKNRLIHQEYHASVWGTPASPFAKPIYGSLYAPPLPTQNLVSLFSTCCQIYVEAIPILYSKNRFFVGDTNAIEYLPRLLLPKRIDSIRFLTFNWNWKGDPPSLGSSIESNQLRNEVWSTVWKNLSEMDGLEELRVQLHFFFEHKWEYLSAGKLESLFELVLAVTTPKIFELSMPMSQPPSTSPWIALPLQIRWTGRGS